jgi:hypothetical protein
MVHHVFLDTWLVEFEAEWRRIHRTVHLEAVSLTAKWPKRWQCWKPGRYGYIMGNTFRPSCAWVSPGTFIRVFAFSTGSPAFGSPRLGTTATVIDLDDYRWPWRD